MHFVKKLFHSRLFILFQRVGEHIRTLFILIQQYVEDIDDVSLVSQTLADIIVLYIERIDRDILRNNYFNLKVKY